LTLNDTWQGRKYPWQDGSDEVIINGSVDPDLTDHAFEMYFYLPRPGYGHLKFKEDAISLKYPGGSGGVFGYFNGDVDAGDIGCLVAIAAAVGIGVLAKNLKMIK
jgi:hypothetical protein